MPDRELSHLHPKFRPLAEKLNAEIDKAGLPIRMFEGNRPMERQAELYAQGRTAPGKKVTNAKPGQSAHNYAMAGDWVWFINGKWSWTPPPGHSWTQLYKCVQKVPGLRWGGSWASFQDTPHVELADWKLVKSQPVTVAEPPIRIADAVADLDVEVEVRAGVAWAPVKKLLVALQHKVTWDAAARRIRVS